MFYAPARRFTAEFLLEGPSAAAQARTKASAAYGVAGVLIVLAVIVSPWMVPISSTCCPA